MVVAGRGERRSARSNRSRRKWRGVDRNQVRDGTNREKGSFEGHGSGSSGDNADAIAKTWLSVGALCRLPCAVNVVYLPP